MNSMNSKLLFLPLRELQDYLTNLEIENEKLKAELTTFSRFNCILENIKRSSNKGFTAMQCIDRNKSCRCNEHLNGPLRRVAQESDIELRVWEEQYNKLVVKSKRDFNKFIDDENGFSSKRSNTVLSVEDLQVESEHETNSSGSVNDIKYYNNKYDTNNLTDNRFRSSYVSNGSDINVEKSDKNGISDETVIRYITLSPSDTESRFDASPPLVVYDSKKDSKLCCDWPECNQEFVNEEILMHHKRNHIRKSIYHCENCSTRLLSKEDLETHLKNHRLSKDEDIEVDVEDKSQSNDVLMLEKTQSVNLVCNKTLNDKNNENSISFESSFDKLNHQKPIAKNDSQSDTLKSALIRPEEYKRTRYSGVGRYRCPWPDCGYTPHFLRDLRRHYKHTGDKKHKCDFPGCDFVSVWKTSLLQHQRKKHSSNDSLINKN